MMIEFWDSIAKQPISAQNLLETEIRKCIRFRDLSEDWPAARRGIECCRAKINAILSMLIAFCPRNSRPEENSTQKQLIERL
ncbi:MAG: hypothetical protein HZA50_11700 [Planctomycetes bacterium]|nr:hypothetical protein [Planctomycetota bacterium]